ncbi:MAG: hypothetical protein ACKVYV_00475 [Limisphaerales bacterium]
MRTVLVVTSADPRREGAAAVAIACAARLAADPGLRVTLCLCEAAPLALARAGCAHADPALLAPLFSALASEDWPVLVETGAPVLQAVGEALVPHRRVTVPELARLAAGSDAFLRF